MGLLRKLFILAAIIGLIVFFFPKSAGGGGSCLGCGNTECECFGFQKTSVAFGPWKSFCFGIPHSCESYVIGENINLTEQEKKILTEEQRNILANLN